MLRQGMVDCEGWDVVSRNPWMQEMNLFYSAKQRAIRDKKEDTVEDPIATALGQKPIKRPFQPTGPRTTPPPLPQASIGKEKLLGRKWTVGQKKPVATADQLPQPTQPADFSSHPEFNRLSFIFRQSVESNILVTAEQTFHRMEQVKLSAGLSDRILFQYVALLAAQKRPVDALRPLQMISSRNAALADPARLRIAIIQIRVLNNPNLALQTLAKIVETPESKPEIIEKRNQLITEAKQWAS